MCCAVAAAQTSFTIRPEVITQCDPNGLGRAQLTWRSETPGTVQIRVDGPAGVAMTGLDPPSGAAETGDWVRDGMVFVLVNESGQELARVTARVMCQPDPLAAALAASSWFPLQVGNEWVYRISTRQVTSQYVLWRVTRAELLDGRLWFVVSQGPAEAPLRAVEVRFRAGDDGKIYQRTAAGGETLWFDPAAPAMQGGVLRVESRGAAVDLSFGRFQDTVSFRRQEPLELERGTFVRGLGLAVTNSTLLAGSSGGFLSGMELVSVRLGDGVRLTGRASGLELTVERAELDVTGRRVTNCAVPCYFVACGLVPGADPPDTYKPCFQARLRGQGSAVDWELLDDAGQAVYRESQALPAGDWAEVFRQLPLYRVPNEPFPPGPYRLRALVKRADGTESAAATVHVELR
jgi:hypothetical protein